MKPDRAQEAAEQRRAARHKLTEFLDDERERCDQRRRLLFNDTRIHYRYTDTGWQATEGVWALALSGGGIRSSTFCLGVLQALAQAQPDDPGLPRSFARASDQPQGLLPLFDYVSSVSGGGFVAGFLQSLYVPKPNPPDPAVQSVEPTASQVCGVLAEATPGRVHNGVTPSPLAWLRENGRYLAPSGAGDLAYVLALSVRNWMGIHGVIGGAVMLGASLLALVELAASTWLPASLRSWWLLPLALFLAWVLPVAGAYWITRDSAARADPKSRSIGHVGGVALSGLALLLISLSLLVLFTHQAWMFYCLGAGALLLLMALWATLANKFAGGDDHGADLAVILTRRFRQGVQIVGLLLALALAVTLAHWLLALPLTHPILAAGGGAGILAAVYHTATKVLPLARLARAGWDSARGSNRMLRIGLAVLAAMLILGVAVFWTAVTFSLMDPCAPGPVARHCEAGLPAAWWNTIAVLILTLLFVGVTGSWPSILNMSSYHYFYSARITRAYLGAANPNRTTAPPGAKSPTATTTTAEPVLGDFVSYQQYHANPIAPLHLINATLNLTVDPAEQLIQRDRKGLPFVVLPDIGRAKSADRVQISIGDRYQHVGGAGATLTIGDWLAISGAAVSSGMGRQTSFGASICATFANARVGRWWPGNAPKDHWLAAALPTYRYLWDEMSGKFYEAQRRYVYLTDGGHFENTATYELLRRVRDDGKGVRLIVMCDCGADPEYRYQDLANMGLLARIDFGLEIKVDHEVTSLGNKLADVFGTPESMGPADLAHPDKRCALLLNVCRGESVVAKIIVIKPRLIDSVPTDLLGYHRDNPAFPQEPTSDQFFDEQQWESYRKLGVECCKTVLDLGPPLWQAVLT